jgi:ATP-dependent DNA helicase RecG
LIKKALKQHGQLGRPEIDELLLDKLPDFMSMEQKIRKIGNLLTYLRQNNIICLGKNKKWKLSDV